jgi:L-asparagine transporter-like permease
VRSPFGGWGSIIGFTVVVAALLKTWWDSRVNFISGAALLLVLTLAYFLLRTRRKETTAIS